MRQWHNSLKKLAADFLGSNTVNA